MDFSPPKLDGLEITSLNALGRYYRERTVKEIIVNSVMADLIKNGRMASAPSMLGIPVRIKEEMPPDMIGLVDGYGELKLMRLIRETDAPSGE